MIKSILRILILAEDKPGWSFGVCGRILREQGHQVDFFNVGNVTFPMAGSLFWKAIYKLTRAFHYAAIDRALEHWIAAHPGQRDLILTCKGDYLSPQRVAWLKTKTGAKLFNWQTDDYFSPTLSSKQALDSIPLYDCIFVHTQANAIPLRERGARRVEYMPHGADPSLYRPIETNEKEQPLDLLFLGNWRRERQAFLEQLVALGVDYRFEVWGFQWEKVSDHSPLQQHLTLKAPGWPDYGALIRRSKISLVFLVHFDSGNTVVPLRLFEIPAAGGFMLVEKDASQAEEFFEPEKEFAYFKDPADLKAQVHRFLSDPNRRQTMAKAAQQKVVTQGHFYTQRMQRLLEVYHQLEAN